MTRLRPQHFCAARDGGHLATCLDTNAFRFREGRDLVHEIPESAHRILDSFSQIERAHQVIHRRRRGRSGAEKHGGITEHLPQQGIVEASGREIVER